MWKRLVEELGKIRPDMPIWLGGPEVVLRFRGRVLRRLRHKGSHEGEGEETFAQLSSGIWQDQEGDKGRERTEGITFRKKMERLSRIHGARQWILARFPLSTATWKHSSIRSSTMRAAGVPLLVHLLPVFPVDKRLRFRDAGLVEKELRVLSIRSAPV